MSLFCIGDNSTLFTSSSDSVIIFIVLMGINLVPVKRDIGSDIAISLK
ncbi:hypothetical protein [Butyrivibrio sp. NC2007]|jgi:hypothetical protein|nr:hypothetical protein [Butyrivibrio sp. NC2007]